MRFNLSYEERRVWEHAKYIFSYVFQTLLILFLIVLLVKEFYPSFIDTRINVVHADCYCLRGAEYFVSC